MDLGWIFVVYLAERLFELWLAGRNRRLLLARGGHEYAAESYRSILALHMLFWIALMVESWPWRVPVDTISVTCLAGLVLLMVLRYWCITSLGPHWNTRIMIVPGVAPVRRGPYRWLRHPNYLVVTLEFALLPLLLRAPVTLIVFSAANLVILRRRINLEETALRMIEGKFDRPTGENT